MKIKFFSHDANAMIDNKIEEMRSVYGMEGYGVYWALIEAMSQENDISLSMSDRQIKALKMKMHMKLNLISYINDCIEIGLFKTDGERFWSDSLRKRCQFAFDIADKRKKAALARWNKSEESKTDKKQDVDEGWKRVVDTYEKEIGLLPMGTAAETLMSYYDDLGADAMIIGIKRTNNAQPDAPFQYLKSILEVYVSKHVKTAAEAEAINNAFDRKRKRENDTQEDNEQDKGIENKDDVRWF